MTFLNDANDMMGSGTDVLDGISGARPRAPKPLPAVDAEFKNGENIDAPPDGAIPLPAVADGETPAPNTTPMEFLHYGTAYRAVSRRFAHAELDDTQVLDLESELGGRGIMFRAALQRETLLLSGFIDSCREALKEDEADKGAVGELMDRVGDLIGGAGGSSGQTAPEDLNPYFDKLTTIATTITAAKVDYPALHKAGIDLHEVRASYRQFLTDQIEAARDKSGQPDAGGAGLLGGLPGLEGMLPPELGNYFKLFKDMAFKAHAVHLILTQEMAVRMEPAIEEAARDFTIEATRSKLSPIFPVWFKPEPPQDNVIDAPSGPGDTGLSPIDNAVGGVVGAMQGAANAVNTVANPVRDFLTLPEEYAPGRPFLDKAFQFSGRATANDQGTVDGDASDQADLLGDVATGALQTAFGFDMPEFVVTVVRAISQVLSGFLRAVYSRLISLDPTQPLNEGDFLEAGRANLVASLIDVVLRSFDVLDPIRKLSIDMTQMPGIERVVSAEAVLDSAIKLIADKVGPHIAPVTDDTMKEIYALLEGARAAHPNAMTMEVYLGVMPAAYARAFRGVFFPFWNMLTDAVVGPAQGAIGGAMGQMDTAVMGVRNQVTDLRNDLDKASKLIDYYGKNGLKVGMLGGDDNTGMAQQILGAPDAFGQAAPQTPVLSPKVALSSRIPTATAGPLTDALLEKVEPSLKWKEPEPEGGDGDDGGSTAP